MCKEIVSSFFVISLILFIYVHQIECDYDEGRKMYPCGNNNDLDPDKCTRNDYYGVFKKGFSLISSCADKNMGTKGLKLHSLVHCIQFGEGPPPNCRKDDKQCRMCQCISYCVLQGLRVIDKNGTVSEPVMLRLAYIMQQKIVEFKNISLYWDACKEHAVSGSPDPCERSFLTLSCMIHFNPKKGPEVLSNLITDLIISQQYCMMSKCTNYNEPFSAFEG